MTFARREFLAAGMTLPLLALPGCSTIGDYGGFGIEDAIRRLLTLSSQRAFTGLLRDEGFFQDDLARLSVPDALGGGRTAAVASVLLRSATVQRQLLELVNDAAAEGARNAAPLVYDSIRDLTITDARAIVRGGPTAATDHLERSIGDRIVTAIFPGVGLALRVLDSGLLSRVLGAATGIDFAGLQQDVSRQAARGIWRVIGREETAIRANPRATGDPALTAIFGLLG